MSRFSALLLGENPFATGMARYDDRYLGESDQARIVVYLVAANQVPIPAIVDTAAPWCILRTDEVRRCKDAITATLDRDYTIRIRGLLVRGRLLRMSLYLRADEGDGLLIDATVFEPAPDELAYHPNFIGLAGFLDRIRFAVDPRENAFYFAAC